MRCTFWLILSNLTNFVQFTTYAWTTRQKHYPLSVLFLCSCFTRDHKATKSLLDSGQWAIWIWKYWCPIWIARHLMLLSYFFWQRPRQPRLMAAGRLDKEAQHDRILTNARPVSVYWCQIHKSCSDAGSETKEHIGEGQGYQTLQTNIGDLIGLK